ncbi:MAG: hypothetical protein HPY87_10090 [Fervidobacterium sp.]|uniref:hypothetical protein n=1 Tax=Fervidobacterium sp. TaxID=1871331 RepID=UPI0025C00F42|nr:hypothetical protein [Fervidobacterium sp.]NPU90209.1 hypothetical protein [Fervidobacterium sp.]
MIYIDSGESVHVSISDSVKVPGLEKISGADIVISPLQAPATTEDLIRLHAENGALFIQRKSGMDLIKSFGDHLNSALVRMHDIGASQSQCILLFIGTITHTEAGYALIDGYSTNELYTSVINGISKWCDRGGVFINLWKLVDLEPYLKTREKHIIEYNKKPTKWICTPLQFITDITDWRATLATFPMIGLDRANSIRSTMIANNLGDDLLTAMKVLTDWNQGLKVNGIGKAIWRSAREWIGLPDHFDLDITYVE